jgi:transposase-like protein
MNKTKRKFAAEFKEQTLGLMSLGKPVADVARDLEVSLSTHPIYFLPHPQNLWVKRCI